MTTRTKLTVAIVAICFIVSAVLLHGQSTYVTGATGTFITNAATRLRMTATNLLGRTSAGSGPIQEIAIGSGLVMTNQTLAATGGGGGTTINSADGVIPVRGDATTFTNSPIKVVDPATMFVYGSNTNFIFNAADAEMFIGPNTLAYIGSFGGSGSRILSYTDVGAGETDNNQIYLISVDGTNSSTVSLEALPSNNSTAVRLVDSTSGVNRSAGIDVTPGSTDRIYVRNGGTNTFVSSSDASITAVSPSASTNFYAAASSGYTGGGTNMLLDNGTYGRPSGLTPGGAAGGALTGTYPNPTLAGGVTAGTYRSVTVQTNGLVSAGTNPTTFSGYGISDTSANLASALTDETGSGLAVFSTNPTLGGVVTNTGVFRLSAGDNTNPAIGFSDSTNTGLYLSGGTIINVTSGGVRSTLINSSLLGLNSAQALQWYSAGFASGDTQLVRDSAATVQMGVDAASVTSPQTFKAADGSGTDKDGAHLQIRGGQSTGTGRGGSVEIGTSLTSTTGSSANGYSARFRPIAKFVDLTDAGTNTLISVNINTNNVLGIDLFLTVYATDGTNIQSQSRPVTIDSVNKAGTLTSTVDNARTNATAASSGTLGYTVLAESSGTTNLLVRVTADSSLTTTTFRAKVIVTGLNSDGLAVITEQ